MTTMLTKKQFAARIGRSVRHLEHLIADGQGPPIVKVGRRAVAIDEADADAWIAARREIPPGWDDLIAKQAIGE